MAERDGMQKIQFPPQLLAERENPKIAETIQGEENIFAARRRALNGEAQILAQRIAQFEKEIEGLNGQIVSEATQLDLIDQEIVGLEALVEQKLSGKQRLLELKRDRAEVAGLRSRHLSAIAQVQQNIAEEQLKILELDTRHINEVVEQLRETQTQRFDISERLRAADDILSRTHIDSPLDGIVVDLQVHTVGGVITPGASVMDIVPVDERLIIEAQVDPADIDSVHPGLTAQVVLTAFNRRNVPPIEGTVVFVSADRLTDPRSGLPYFLARIVLPDDPHPNNDNLVFVSRHAGRGNDRHW